MCQVSGFQGFQPFDSLVEGPIRSNSRRAERTERESIHSTHVSAVSASETDPTVPRCVMPDPFAHVFPEEDEANGPLEGHLT